MADDKKKIDDKDLEKVTGGTGKAIGGSGNEVDRTSGNAGTDYNQAT